ncbi:hypothetical protein HPB49_010289 [Dermacentor silvarum]|uniref:Uncharacterized protein n=1 Tax=Dermacentor silvarum TaxID=543639 RepID=A0ACB8D4N9_DERSI|nr:hypothetical protein HPB49_010289 [Dermacentor silvarum]
MSNTILTAGFARRLRCATDGIDKVIISDSHADYPDNTQKNASYDYQNYAFYSIDIPLAEIELLCTVGHAAISNNMYPPEGICTYLFYTDVVIVDSKIVPSRERNSWKMFKMKAKSYKAVKSGIAFDHRYIRPNLISQAMGELTMLAGNNIASYGLLNIIGKPDELHQTVLATKPVMEADFMILLVVGQKQLQSMRRTD